MQQHEKNNDVQQQDHARMLTLAEAERQSNDTLERLRIIEWMSPLNFFQRQADIFSTWQPGTGGWLLDDTQFKAWESSSGQTLWCCGMRGAGKTVLSSTVVNHLRASAEVHNNTNGVACIHLNHKETDAQTPLNLLGSLCKQLVVDKSLPTSVHTVYNHHKERQTRPSLNEVLKILHTTISEYSKVYFVVDALDEYPEGQRKIFIKYLATAMGGHDANLMMTSRPHITLPDALFPDLESMEIRAAEDDIRQYVDTHILESPRLSRHVQTRPELREEIRGTIIRNAEGMFLLAKLHCESLATKNTVKAVRQALQHLPKDLTQTYDEAMERIDCQNDDDKELARLALTWVANAKRLLSVAELCEALAIEQEGTTFDVENIVEIDIVLSACAGLLIVDETMAVVRLIHFTTQHYFDSVQAVRFPMAHTEITSRCLTYLFLQEDLLAIRNSWDTHEAKALVVKHPFLGYGQYCLLHAMGQPYPPSSISPLWFSASANLLEISSHLLVDGISASGRADELNSALCGAAFYGHMEMVQLLIKSGADANAEGDDYGYGRALQASSYAGHDHITQFLISNGADVNLASGEYGPALKAASWMGQHRVIQLLVENGADIMSRKDGSRMPLQAASLAGHEAVVRLLIEEGAEVNATEGVEGTALQFASGNGYESVARLLVEKGAEVNAQGGKYGTALQAASHQGNEQMVKFLIESGADVNFQGGKYGTALQAAAEKGCESVVQILIKNGTDVNARGGKYGTALQAASRWRNEHIVLLLIAHGADTSVLSEGPDIE
ncbi:ankyrin repeat-containing domain protein [Mycena vulgaris]|nr:ankyrin repeat-containing domain protein [Mycena vulgaris]